MNIPEGTVLAHAKRHGWTQQIQVATQQQSDAITPVQPVPQSIAAILSERNPVYDAKTGEDRIEPQES